MNYTITTNAGATIEFSTELSVAEAYQIVEGLPQTNFLRWVLRDRGNRKNNLWALKVAHDVVLERTKEQAEPQKTCFSELMKTVAKMQEGAKRQVILRFEGATVKAVTKGINTGAAYVYAPNGTYMGKIAPNGEYNGSANVTEALEKAEVDPKGAAVKYGRQTGSCSCCGRELSDPVSIFGGIGPICLGRLAGPDARAELEADYREHQAAALLDQVLAMA